jgi:hypothetical protein
VGSIWRWIGVRCAIITEEGQVREIIEVLILRQIKGRVPNTESDYRDFYQNWRSHNSYRYLGWHEATQKTETTGTGEWMVSFESGPDPPGTVIRGRSAVGRPPCPSGLDNSRTGSPRQRGWGLVRHCQCLASGGTSPRKRSSAKAASELVLLEANAGQNNSHL